MTLKDEIIELMEYNDLNIVDHNINGAIEIINGNVTITNDDFYIFESCNDVDEIERLTGLQIDDILKNWGFSDEYVSCNHCNNVIYLSERYYYISNNEIICGDCLRENKDFQEDYIEYLINNHEVANTILTVSQLKDIDFKPCNCNDDQCKFWAGLRDQKQDNPENILKKAIKLNPDLDYIFDIINISMFDIEFTLYHRCKNE